MTAKIEIDGIELVSVREASNQVSYSRDYITRLAREDKIVASLIGRQWFVDIDSLKNYFQQSALEADLRKSQLREDRKQEQIFQKKKEQVQTKLEKKRTNGHIKAVAMAGLVLALGLTTGQLLVQPLLSDLSTVQKNNSLTAANVNAVPETTPEQVIFVEGLTASSAEASLFTQPKITNLGSDKTGVLLVPDEADFAPEDVFSDEVLVHTASSGVQSVRLVGRDGEQKKKMVPFVLVPIKSTNN